MQIISSSEFEQFCQQDGLKVLKVGRGTLPKVYEKDNIIIKLFYPKKKRLSSNTIKPQALRFNDNCHKLQNKGYIAPNVLNIQYCKDLRIHLVHYDKIIGDDVRSLANQGHFDVVDKVAVLVADLHHRGIYFRCIHLENLLYQQDGHFALIDITDVRFKHKPLSLYTRYRNLRHLFYMHEDREFWKQYGITRFLDGYFKAAKLSPMVQQVLRYLVKRAVERF